MRVRRAAPQPLQAHPIHPSPARDETRRPSAWPTGRNPFSHEEGPRLRLVPSWCVPGSAPTLEGPRRQRQKERFVRDPDPTAPPHARKPGWLFRCRSDRPPTGDRLAPGPVTLCSLLPVQLLFRPQLSHTDSALQLWGKYSTALNARLSASKSPSLGSVSRSIGPALVLPHKIAFPVALNCVLFLSPRGRVLVPSPPFVLQRKLQRLQGEHARGGKWGTSESRGTMPPRGRRDALSACCARCLFPPVLWFGLDEGGAPGRSASRCWAPADLTTCDPSPHSTQPSLQIHRWKASPGRPRPPPQTKHTETRSIAARPAARSGSEGPRSRVAPRTGMLLTPPVAGGGALADEGKGVGGAVCEKRTDDVRPLSFLETRLRRDRDAFLAAR
ncbi:hypothetical protein ACCO45_003246 [Purpureocillium lilacinum]|uniref:Uncharacterized protein n=1 Tax=Purpureocillium lilacinum TaxID=33203 RepID=A0ACC4E0B0_PURLI